MADILQHYEFPKLHKVPCIRQSISIFCLVLFLSQELPLAFSFWRILLIKKSNHEISLVLFLFLLRCCFLVVVFSPTIEAVFTQNCLLFIRVCVFAFNIQDDDKQRLSINMSQMEMKIMIHGASHTEKRLLFLSLSSNQLAVRCMRKTNIYIIYLLRASWVIDFMFGVMEHVFSSQRTI